ncbi:MAG: hypothetical protein Q8N78_10995, partial [Sulfurimonas sp.]|nr:hypothetical protein [Sulfurimonas sp.]
PVIPPPPPVTPPPTDPVIPPTDPITPPPTDPVTPPTDPITPPPTDPVIPPPPPPVTPPPTVPVIPPTDPITPPPSGGGGGGGEVVQSCPSGTTGTYPNCVDIPPQTTSYTTLFSDMSASDGANSTVFFPDETIKTMVFDATNGLWKSSDNAYVVTSTDGNFSYINELSGTQTMYVKDLTQSYNPVLFKSFPTDSNASGYLSGVSGLNPIASTHYELVTGVKGVMNEYSYAIKYEQNSQYDTRKWEYLSSLKLFQEYHYQESEWFISKNFAALYNDISDSNTTYQSSILTLISNQSNPYMNFYIHGTPDANQSLKNYGILADGGKWYFTYDKTNPYFSTTVNVYGDLPITDAVSTSGEYVPFMKTYDNGTAYPIFTVNKDGYKEMYSIKDFSDTSNSVFNEITQNYLLVNTNYVSLDETNTSINTYYLNGNTQNTYQFYKIDENGTLITDSRNAKLVNPLTSNPLNLYVNFHLGDDTYFSGPIDNPLLDNDTLPTPTSGNSISYSEGITPNSLNISILPQTGSDYRKLAIEKAVWDDKPVNNLIYLYSNYTSDLNDRNFSKTSKTGAFIKFPTDSDGIMMESYFDVLQEKDSNLSIVKNYFTGSITTGRVVSSDTNASNKIILKHFDTIGGVITTDSTTDYGTTHGFYLFNENAQFINADNGGLDNDQTDSETKYSWIAHEEINATTSEAANVNLMKKITDSSDTYLFTSSFDYNTSFATGSMSGFMIGEDTSINVWMGDISAFDTNASGGRGILTITSTENNLTIAAPLSMAGLTQTDAAEAIPSASFLGEDMQAMIIESKTINGKTYDFAMATLPDTVVDGSYSYQNDYTSWGYWVATEKAPTAGDSYAQGYWVAGYESPSDINVTIPANTTYSYNGHVL